VENFKRWEPTAIAKTEDNIGAESQKSWIEPDKGDLSSLDDAVSLRSFKAKDGEERSVVGDRLCEVTLNRYTTTKLDSCQGKVSTTR